MARSLPSKNPYKNQPLTNATLDFLKQMSPTAFAMGVYGAAVNNDLASLDVVSRYLLERDASELATPDGKSLLNREQIVAGYVNNDAGKVVESKDKAYVHELLFYPLAQLPAEVFRKDPAARQYAERLLELPDRLKLDSRQLTATVGTLAYGAPHGLFEEVVERLIDKMKTAAPLLDFIQNPTYYGRDGRLALPAEPGEELLNQRLDHLARYAMGCESFCQAFMKDLEQDSRKDPVHALGEHRYRALRRLGSADWPVQDHLRAALQDIFAAQALADIDTFDVAYKIRSHEISYPNPVDLHEPRIESPAEYLAAYANTGKPVPKGISDLAIYTLPRVRSGADKAWAIMAPIQKMIDEHGGRPIWLGLTDPRTAVPVEFVTSVVQSHGPLAPDACTEALACLGESLHRHSSKQGFIPGTQVTKANGLVPVLLAAGAQPDKPSDSVPSFVESLSKLPPKDRKELAGVDTALHAAAARQNLFKHQEPLARKAAAKL